MYVIGHVLVLYDKYVSLAGELARGNFLCCGIQNSDSCKGNLLKFGSMPRSRSMRFSVPSPRLPLSAILEFVISRIIMCLPTLLLISPLPYMIPKSRKNLEYAI